MAKRGLFRASRELFRSAEPRRVFKDYADDHFMTFYGEVSEPLLNLLKTHSVGHKWFCFLQGLEPSAVIP
jgi:hypothetical protein